jgi:hypothetical protein
MESLSYLVLDGEEHRGPALFFIPSCSRLHYRMSTEDNWNDGLDTDDDLSIKYKNHVAFVIDYNRLIIYVHGYLVADKTLDAKVNFRPDAFFVFGHSKVHSSFTGDQLRNFRFYNRTLDENIMSDKIVPVKVII